MAMECQWLGSRRTFTLLLLFCCLSISTLYAADPPVIDIVGGITNTSIVTFQNGTHIVVSRNVSSIILMCNASYPVMWTLDSLEQPWASSTKADRFVTDFKNKSTYTYSMSVSLGNNNGYPYATQLSVEPEQYECRFVNSSSNLITKMTVIWEWKDAYWNVKHNKYLNGKYQVYWKASKSGESTEILIPCYSLSWVEMPVQLFKREPTKAVKWLASDNGTDFSLVRFEKYVGFFIKSSLVQSDNETYECHLILTNSPILPSKGATYIYQFGSEFGSGSGSIGGSTKSPMESSGDGESAETQVIEDYTYIESEEDLLGRNTTRNYTQPAKTNDTTVPWSISSVAFSLIKLDPSAYQDEIHATKKSDLSEDTLSSYLNRENPNLILEHNDTSISCCIKPGYNSSFTSDHLVLYHKWCSEPLMCLTTKHLMKKTYILYYAKYDHVASKTCRTINLTGEYKSSFASNPALYICHMRTDRHVTRYAYNGDYDLKYHRNSSENSYYLSLEKTSTLALLQYYNQSRYTYLNDISNVSFYDGETAMFRCVGNGFYYTTSGYIWELQWKNGSTTQHTSPPLPSYYTTYNSLKVNLTDNLEKISCHIPLWNSSDWVTRSFSIKVQASRPPTTASGESSAVEEVEFYAGQSKVLKCDLQGHPPVTTYRWNISSSVYSFLERTPYYSHYYYTRRTSVPSSYREPTTSNVTVSLYAVNYVENSTLPISQETFTCTASNIVGNGTKIFKVKALRTTKPEIAFGHREVAVLFLHDEHQSLNCTILRGLPFPELYWQKHGMNISSTSDHYDIKMVGNSSILTFKMVDYPDEGDYRCVVANLAGRGFKDINVRVRERPHSRYWYEFAIFLLTLVLIILFGSLAYVYVSKSKKINSLKLRAEYSNLFGRHESRITVATMDD